MDVKWKILAPDQPKGIVGKLKDLATGNPTVGDISPIAKMLRIPKREIEFNAQKTQNRAHEK